MFKVGDKVRVIDYLHDDGTKIPSPERDIYINRDGIILDIGTLYITVNLPDLDTKDKIRHFRPTELMSRVC